MTASPETRDFLLQFAQAHVEFRRAEIQSLAALNGVKLDFVAWDEKTPFAHVRITPASKAGLLVERSILTKRVVELWGSGANYDELHESVKKNLPQVWTEGFVQDTFKFHVDAYHGKRSLPEQRIIIDNFAYMPFKGEIDLKKPDHTFCVFEAYRHPEGKKAEKEPYYIYFGRLVGEGSRACVDKYDLKKRPYIGTTSMDAELTLITANMGLCASGKLAYDPFVGTGSFMVACAHFGSIAYGSDIDGRMIRGKKTRNIVGNFKHYGLMDYFGDCFISDLTNTPIRPNKQWLDSIVCDPPYGIREGLKVLGCRDPAKEKGVIIRDGVARHLMPDYIPPKRPYGFEAMMNDILDFSVENLRDDGRLCMWMPTANDELETYTLPSHPVLELLHVCVQDFGNWSRQLLVYRRKRTGEYDQALWGQRINERKESKEKYGSADELNSFRAKYFQGFKSAQEGTGADTSEVAAVVDGLGAVKLEDSQKP